MAEVELLSLLDQLQNEYAEYKRSVSNTDHGGNSLYVTSYVPLKVLTKSKSPQIIWKNPRPLIKNSHITEIHNFPYKHNSRSIALI